MREILFRGKRNNPLNMGEWVEGYLCYNNSRELGIQPENDNLCYGVIPETIGQYTGLTDKNGTKIFEGDIVKVKTSSNDGTTVEITRVGYDIKFCGFFPMRWEESCDGCDCYFRIEEIEVIGNIHDNPELLEVKQ